MKAVFKAVDDVPGKLTDNIRKSFLLSPVLAA